MQILLGDRLLRIDDSANVETFLKFINSFPIHDCHGAKKKNAPIDGGSGRRLFRNIFHCSMVTMPHILFWIM